MESKQYYQSLSYEPLICRVCGDVARGNNFQVLTCMSCKSFFRRNALLPWGILQCQEKNKCIITKKTRPRCAACRLKKCFLLGMNPNLIRQINRHNLVSTNFQQHSQIINRNKASLSRLQSLEPLKHDSLTLTSEQWTLLLNIIHVYDEQNPLFKIKYLFEKQSALPLKLRFKPVDTLNLIGAFIQSIQPTIERAFHFQRLSIIARRTLIKNNFEGVGTLHGFFGIHKINAFNDSVFIATCQELYGFAYLTHILSVCNRNFSIVTFKDENDVRMMLDSVELVKIQNIYVNMLWKYMNYQYGFNKAVRCLDDLMKNILDILHIMENLANVNKHNLMINTIIKQAECSLTIENWMIQ